MGSLITRTPELAEKVRRNFYLRKPIEESAEDLGLSYTTLNRMEKELKLARPRGGYRRPKNTSKNTMWEGIHFMVINLCRTYCIVAKRSRNPKYEIAQKMAIQEIVYSAKGETLDQILALAKRWDREYK